MKPLTLAVCASAFIANAEPAYEMFMQRARAPAPAPAAGPALAPGPGASVDNTVKTKEIFVNEVENTLQEAVKENPEDFEKPTPTLLGWEVEFNIENYNYFDLNKALVVPQEPPSTTPQLAKPKPEIEEKAPKFWSSNAVDMSWDKTGKQVKQFPKTKERDGLYPVDLSNGAKIPQIGTDRTESAKKAEVPPPEPAETKTVAVKEEEEEKPETVKKVAVSGEASKQGAQGSLSKTQEQFNDFLNGDTPQHDTKGELYPSSGKEALLQTKAQSQVGRCLTEEGMFEDTCVVDVLRDSIKSAFVDLVETVLDTPAERQDLLDWFTARQGKKELPAESAASFVSVREHLMHRAHAPAPAAAASPAGAGAPAPGGPVVETAVAGKIGTDTVGSPAAAGPAAAGPAGAPSPAAAAEFKADVFVQFYPGEERPVVEDGEVGRSIIAKVWIRGMPNTGVFELAPWIEGALKRHEEDGLLEILLEKRLFDATGIAPMIDGITDIRLDAKVQWSLETCESHMKKIVREFSKAYTRRMVPTAIYNECTNFVSEVSFSHDRIFDAHDRIKCRHATVKLAKEWNFGKGHPTPVDEEAPAPAAAASPAGPAAVASPAAPAAPAKPEIDYKGFCSNVCEIKYGVDAPTCHVTEGKKLFSAAP